MSELSTTTNKVKLNNAKVKSRKRKKVLSNILTYISLSIAVLFIVLPLFVTIFASFKTRQQIGVDFPLQPPTSLNL
ncbi:MAG: hypothetical protein ACRC7R_04870, partial [Sarcina sp.]